VVNRRLLPGLALLLSFVATVPALVHADAITGSTTTATDVGVTAVPYGSSTSTEPTPTTTTSTTSTTTPVPIHTPGTMLFDDAGASLLYITPSQLLDLFTPREKLRDVSLVPDGVIAGLGSGVPSGAIGNVSFAPGGDPLANVGPGGAAPLSTPEPSTLLLMASGMAVAARRLTRLRRA
jgi:hypothetical protein